MCTSVDAVVLVQVVHCIENLTDRLGSVLLGELALLANAIEQLSSSRELSYDVVLVLQTVRLYSSFCVCSVHTRDSNQSWNLTMCGCFIFCSISSSS